MRVICIEDSLIIDRDNPSFGSVSAHKGCVYNVIGSVDGEVMRKNKGKNFASGVWYEFLELQGLHHHVRFLEIPEDDVEIETNSQVAELVDDITWHD